ncbi:MAG: serine/threonine protein kinase [Muribaculaceae bacterium]|nr:serine/threonine protein kinase [Muribaculaceae bacterium]
MKINESAESGIVEEVPMSAAVGSSMTDIEILRVSRYNLMARGSRYGRHWFIKSLSPDLRDSSSMKRRLMKEFELHSRLHNPAIVNVVNIEPIDGLGECIIMEWINGRTLAQTLEEKSLSRSECRRIMHDIIAAVAYLHSEGIVHRDLKPSNIMLRNNGRSVVLIDFGLADADDYMEMKNPAGTPGFISPEQYATGGAHATDDVYSLGVIMKELCPEYRKIATRCTGPVARRPKDAQDLLRLFDRRMRRRRNAWIAVAAALATVIIFAGISASSRMKELGLSAEQAKQMVETLTVKDRLNSQKIGELNDSLAIVTDKMVSAEADLAKAQDYMMMKEKAFVSGCREIDNFMKRKDKIFGKMTPDESVNYEFQIMGLASEGQKIIDDYVDKSVTKKLTSPDRETLRLELTNYFGNKIGEYQKKWTKKIYPDMILP